MDVRQGLRQHGSVLGAAHGRGGCASARAFGPAGIEIPNYDSENPPGDGSFKQLCSYMPDQTFRMLIAGPSGGGKTNLLTHILREPLIHYDKVYLYSKNLEQGKYQNLQRILDAASRDVGYDVIECSNDEIIPVDELPTTNQKVIVFDDFLYSDPKACAEYFIRGRNKNCSVIYLSQSFYGTPKDIRVNCSHFCIFDFPGKTERGMVARELGVSRCQYEKATRDPHSFLYVDRPRKRCAKNFCGEI